MKNLAKRALRAYCPNIPALRRAMANVKLREVNRCAMSPADVAMGESSVENQTGLAQRYMEKWPQEAALISEKFNEYAANSDSVGGRSDLGELLSKVAFARFAYGFLPDEFFSYGLEGMKPEQIRSFMSDRDVNNLIYKANDIIDLAVFFDKFKTYQRFKSHYKREAIQVASPSDKRAFKAFAQAHPVFVIKNTALSKGESVRLIDTAEVDIDELFVQMLSEGRYIVEERVVQSKTMSCLSRRSVNTVRCITLNSNGRVAVEACFLKVGQGESFVDNGGAGGILVGIDGSTGRLDTVGFDEFLARFEEHPDTHITFMGYQLPEWPQLLDLATSMSAKIPSVRYIGWDLAHTEDGWVVIEGNGGSQQIGPQIVWGRGFKKEVEELSGISF